MNIHLLKQFIHAANNAGYASDTLNNFIKEKDGSTSIIFSKGKWKSVDHFYGGEPYGGMTVIHYKNKPCWIMVYYGWVKKSTDTKIVYDTLKKALRKMPKNYPFRGPKQYKTNNYVYINTWKGTVKNFKGEEQISDNSTVVYKASYMGGLIDIHPSS